MSDKTIEYYDLNAESFVAGTEHADMKVCRDKFLKYLAPGGRILDAGCGSGRDILAFQKEGYEVDAFDASAELCRIASEKTGTEVQKLRFEELTGEDLYDGIWACASLLHVKSIDLPDVLCRLYKLLKAGGVLYASFKYGFGEREKDGRYFCDLDEEKCRALLDEAGLVIRELFITKDVRKDRDDEQWVNAIAKRDRRIVQHEKNKK